MIARTVCWVFSAASAVAAWLIEVSST